MSNNIKIKKCLKRVVEIGLVAQYETRFLTLLQANKMRQIDLAHELEVDKAYIWRIVHGREWPPIHIRLKIAAVLKTDSALIFREHEWVVE